MNSALTIRLLQVFIALLVAGCATPSASPATPKPLTLTFMAGYKAQANLPFVAVYVAQEQGYFAQQGLQVDIHHSTGQGEHLKLLLQGTVDVTTATADAVLKRRAEGDLPIVAFALFGQRGDRAFAVLEDSGIHGPRDFEGRTVGYKLYQTPDYLAMLRQAGVDRAKVQEVPVGFDPRMLSQRAVDVYPVFVSNEPDLLHRLGISTRLFHPSDYGVPTLGLTYVTRADLLDQSGDVLERFLKATLKGAAFAQADPERAIDIVMRYAPQESRPHQLAMLMAELEMAAGPVSDQHGVGWQTREQWQALHDSLLEHGGLDRPADVATVFSNVALQRVYRDGSLLWP